MKDCGRWSAYLDSGTGALGLAADGEEDLKPQDEAEQDGEVGVAPWPLGRSDPPPRRIGAWLIWH